jgi:hypothetical protein
MSVDEMRDEILYSDLGDHTQDLIITALRAGEGMRSGIYPGSVVSITKLRAGAELWDAATKEDV